MQRRRRVVSPFSKTRDERSMVLERRARYRTFQTRSAPLFLPSSFCIATHLYPLPFPLSPLHDNARPTPAVFRAGIRNVVDKILRAAICRPVTPCRRRSLDFACRSNSLDSFPFLMIFARALDDSSLGWILVKVAILDTL